MFDVNLWPNGPGKWGVNVGEFKATGTHEECLAFLLERQAECLRLSQEIRDMIKRHTFDTRPYQNAMGE